MAKYTDMIVLGITSEYVFATVSEQTGWFTKTIKRIRVFGMISPEQGKCLWSNLDTGEPLETKNLSALFRAITAKAKLESLQKGA